MKSVILAVFGLMFLPAFGSAQDQKPKVFISGEGNLTIYATGESTGIAGVRVGSSRGSVSKHNQTIEMAGDFQHYCPNLVVTLDPGSAPDYFVDLNREGSTTGRSQIMVLDSDKHLVSTAKAATVKNAVKIACNTIYSDWQANGRRGATAGEPKTDSVAIVMDVTARAQKYCKPETIAAILADMKSYLTSKDVSIGRIPTASYALVLTVDRPITKWLEITVQAKRGDSLLWSEKISDGSWTHTGTAALDKGLQRLHGIVDGKLGEKNGLPTT